MVDAAFDRAVKGSFDTGPTVVFAEMRLLLDAARGAPGNAGLASGIPLGTGKNA